MSRLSAEEMGNRVADVLFATVKANIHELVKLTRMPRSSVVTGIRWLRKTLGDEALVCDADNNYAFAMTKSDVKDYRARRLSFLANSAETLIRVCEAGDMKLGGDAESTLAIESIRFGVKLLRRGIGGPSASPALERV
jgi:hypothetical protein